MAKEIIGFKPKDITKKMLSSLQPRVREVLIRRYGLGAGTERATLESIGSIYKITRERVRQIENFGIAAIKKSKNYNPEEPAFMELKGKMDDFGGIVHEQSFLDHISSDTSTKNHLHFILVVSDAFYKLKEDDSFHHRWTTDKNLADKVQVSLKNLTGGLNEKDLLPEPDLVSRFLTELKDVAKDDPRVEDFAKRWLFISKQLAKNPLGEWGLIKSPNVKMRGIRDFAYLVLRQNGSPMHFSEVASAIDKHFGRKAHPATCHNELIKDDRFVLVGRGLYALAEWGYSKGTVADVIRALVKKNGSLTREEVIAKVLKERHVKENTILVNLQNPKLFKRNKDGRYITA